MIILSGKEPPRFDNSMKMEDFYYIDQGLNLTLYCPSIGTPKPKVTWSKVCYFFILVN